MTSLYEELLSKENLKTCLSRAFKEENIDCLQIYFDLYAHHNPKLGNFVTKQYNNTELEDRIRVGNIIKTMFFHKPSNHVYLSRLKLATHVPKPLKGRPPKWCMDYEKQFRPFLRYFHLKQYESAIKTGVNPRTPTTFLPFFHTFLHYVENVRKIKLRSPEYIKTQLQTMMDLNVCLSHYLLAMFHYFDIEESEIVVKPTLLFSENDTEVNGGKPPYPLED